MLYACQIYKKHRALIQIGLLRPLKVKDRES